MGTKYPSKNVVHVTTYSIKVCEFLLHPLAPLQNKSELLKAVHLVEQTTPPANLFHTPSTSIMSIDLPKKQHTDVILPQFQNNNTLQNALKTEESKIIESSFKKEPKVETTSFNFVDFNDDEPDDE